MLLKAAEARQMTSTSSQAHRGADKAKTKQGDEYTDCAPVVSRVCAKHTFARSASYADALCNLKIAKCSKTDSPLLVSVAGFGPQDGHLSHKMVVWGSKAR